MQIWFNNIHTLKSLKNEGSIGFTECLFSFMYLYVVHFSDSNVVQKLRSVLLRVRNLLGI